MANGKTLYQSAPCKKRRHYAMGREAMGGKWKNGQAEQISLFLGLLSGDISGLKTQFDATLVGEAKHWSLTLTPSSLLMKQIFNHIEIQGDTVVKTIVLDEKQGDKIQIHFDNVQQNQPLKAFAQAALE